MRITILGSGSPLPDPNRAGPSTLVQAGGASLLVDCGRGALMRLAAAGGSVQNLTAVLITHLHSDHITDLNDVITSRWALSLAPNPLRVVGPEGTGRVVERTLTMLEDDIGYRLEHHDDLTEPPQVEVTEVNDGPVDLGVAGIVVTAAPERIPDPLLEQLAVGAHMVIPVGDFYQELMVITRTESGFEERSVIPVRFVPMTGEIERQD